MKSAPMNFILKRRSIREFESTPVPRRIIKMIVKAGQRAPTASGIQAYSFVLVTDSQIRERISSAIGGQRCMKQAPVWIVICADFARQGRLFEELNVDIVFGKANKFMFSIIDATLAAQNMVIAAEMLGLGSVFVGAVWKAMKKIADVLSLPNEVLPVVLLCLGYPAESPPLRPRWPLKEVMHENTYRMPSKNLIRRHYAKTNRELVKMKYFRPGIASLSEHWRKKYEKPNMRVLESILQKDLFELGFTPW